MSAEGEVISVIGLGGHVDDILASSRQESILSEVEESLCWEVDGLFGRPGHLEPEPLCH